MTLTLPASVWRSVAAALADYIQFGPGNLDAEYVPDEDLERALRLIRGRIEQSAQTADEMAASLKAE